jgi:hypothetical protein
MIELKAKYEGVFLHCLTNDYLIILKEQQPDLFYKYFEEK